MRYTETMSLIVQVQLEEDSPTLYNAHVQEINEPKGPVVVFIEELGER